MVYNNVTYSWSKNRSIIARLGIYLCTCIFYRRDIDSTAIIAAKNILYFYKKFGNLSLILRDVFKNFRDCLNCVPTKRRRVVTLASLISVTLSVYVYICKILYYFV